MRRGGGSSGTTSAPVAGVISGTVTKGPVSNATVAAYGVGGGQVGAQIGATTTDANGNFSVAIGSYAGPVMLQVSAGTYTDEATGNPMTMAPGDVMTVVMPTIAAGATTSSVQVTPVTAMAQAVAQHMAGGMTDANIAAANTAMGNYFSVTDIVHTQPMNPLVTGSGTGASQDAQNYGMTLAAMSKYAQTLGMSSSSAMVTAMMNDAADGMMDGKAGSAPVPMGGMGGGMMMPPTAGTSGLGAAMNAFMTSTQNRSGVTTPTLMGKLNGANGQIVGSGTPMTSATLSGTAFDGPVSKAMVTAFAINGGVGGRADRQRRHRRPWQLHHAAGQLHRSGDAANERRHLHRRSDRRDHDHGRWRRHERRDTDREQRSERHRGLAHARSRRWPRRGAAGMSGGMTDANIAAANTAVGNYFSVTRHPPHTAHESHGGGFRRQREPGRQKLRHDAGRDVAVRQEL